MQDHVTVRLDAPYETKLWDSYCKSPLCIQDLASLNSLWDFSSLNLQPVRQTRSSSESDVLHFALNHGFVAFVLGGFDEIPHLDWSELWSLPGILRAAIHASFVLLRDRLINICNDTALSNSTHTDVHLMLQGDGAFVLSAQDEQALAGPCSVQQCCAVTQWLLRLIYWFIYLLI